METLRQTIEHQDRSLDKFKRQVGEYVNLIMSGDARGNDTMDLGRGQTQGEDPREVWYKESTDERIDNNAEQMAGYRLGELCHKCRGAVH